MCAIERPVSLAGSRMGPHYHACAFFHSRDEEYDILAPFVAEGAEHGDKAIHVTAPDLRDEHLQHLVRRGVDVASIQRRDQLDVLTWDEAYLKDGTFDPDEMLALFEGALDLACAQGFPRTRIIGHMEWALEGKPGVDRLLEYESRVNHLLASRRQPAVCAYDANRFPASLMLDILRVHPLVIIGGVLQENPFFVPPDRFLRELRPEGSTQYV